MIANNERNDEPVCLVEHMNKRKETFDMYSSFLNEAINGKKKQIRFRKWFYNRLKYCATHTFETEDDENEFISKFGRGMWCEEMLRKTYNAI